jgi:excisionase family DNA binding protein
MRVMRKPGKGLRVMSIALSPLTLSPTKAAQYLGLGKTKTLELIRAKRLKVFMLDGRIRVSTEACREFLNSLPDQYVKGVPVKDGKPVTPAKPKAKHGRRKTRH